MQKPIIGTVISYDDVKGSGIILGNNKLEYTISADYILNGNTLRPGQMVQFDRFGKKAGNIDLLRNQKIEVFYGVVYKSEYGDLIRINNNENTTIQFNESNCQNCINQYGELEPLSNGEPVSFLIDSETGAAIDIKRILNTITRTEKKTKTKRKRSKKNLNKAKKEMKKKAKKNNKQKKEDDKTETIHKGFVKFYGDNKKKGFEFGFIVVNSTNDELYFDENKTIGHIETGDCVKFVIREQWDGRKYCALVQKDEKGIKPKIVKFDTLLPLRQRKKKDLNKIKLGNEVKLLSNNSKIIRYKDNYVESVNSEIRDNYDEISSSSLSLKNDAY